MHTRGIAAQAVVRACCAALALSGCAGTYRLVEVPPAVTLDRFPAVGVVQFVSPNGRDDLALEATQRFMEELAQAQPGARVVELGTTPEVLAQVNKPWLDADAVRQLGARNHVQAIFTGVLDVAGRGPRFGVPVPHRAGGFQQSVTGLLAATLYDASRGAVVWSRSVPGAEGPVEVAVEETPEVETPEENTAYSRFIIESAYALTETFRPRWVRQKLE